MDFEKLNLIKQDVLKFPLEQKPYSDDMAGVYVEGGNRPFLFSEHDAPFHAFRAISQYEYPIYLFINEAHTEELPKLLEKYSNVKVTLISELQNSFHYNWWMTHRCFNHIDSKHENLITFQSDGFLTKPNWEEFCINYDYIGAVWKESVRLWEDKFKLPETFIGNGGFSFRKLSKIRQVLKAVEDAGGYQMVKGMFLNNELRLAGYSVNEDVFFCYFGFGLKIFKPISNEEINKFSLEPIKLSEYFSDNRPFGFHKIDE